MNSLKKYLHVFGVQLKNNFVREVVYRNNFLTMTITDIIWISVEFFLFNVIYANVPTLAGWTKEQSFFFLGIFFASDALFTVFFQRNFWTFSDLVNKGELDILLTKPIHPLFLALTRFIQTGAILNVLFGLGIIFYYADAAQFPGGWRWLLLPLWLCTGLTLNALVRFVFSVVVFWTDRGWAIARLYYQMYQFATKPDSIYPKFIRYAILTFIPFAFIGSVPARALIHGLQWKEAVALATALTGFFVADRLAWKAGLKRYQSASS